MRSIDPRAKSSQWRVKRALAMYKRNRMKIAECLAVMVDEGLTLSYTERLLAPIEVLREEKRLLKNRRAREAYAARRAAKS